jgi:hypothetical protein
MIGESSPETWKYLPAIEMPSKAYKGYIVVRI